MISHPSCLTSIFLFNLPSLYYLMHEWVIQQRYLLAVIHSLWSIAPFESPIIPSATTTASCQDPQPCDDQRLTWAQRVSTKFSRREIRVTLE